MAAKPQVPGLMKGLGVTFKTLGAHDEAEEAGRRRQHGAVPAREGSAADPGPRRHRPARGQLHGVHAVRPQLPRLVHLHRGSQGARPAAPCRRRAAQGQQARPLRHRLRAVHVLRHLRRGVPVRCAVLEPGVRVQRAEDRRPAARQDQARRVDGDRARGARARSRRRQEEARSDAARRRHRRRPERRLRHHRRDHDRRRAQRRAPATTSCTPRCRWSLVHGRRRRAVPAAGRRVRRRHPGARLHRRRDGAVPVRRHAHPGQARHGDRPQQQELGDRHPGRAADARCHGVRADRRLRATTSCRSRRAPGVDGRAVSDSIFRPYLLPFWALSFVLLAAVIGAIVLARKD